ncbi:MAG: hypothetical protein L3J35_12630 [Bacteroidales bacterium]|nr:hypothetical protein [Bacteroidales bacterium]
MSKKRILLDFEKLNQEIKEQVKLSYPEGFTQHLIEYTDIKGNSVSALPFETEDKIYLIRMSVTVAQQLITDDFDYDDDGFLKEEIKEIYTDKYTDPEEDDDEPEDDFNDSFDVDAENL